MIRRNRLVSVMSVVLLCAVWVTTGLFSACGDDREEQAKAPAPQADGGDGKGDSGGEPDLVIAIDAGHGGMDPGKVGVDGQLEKDINLSIALLLKSTLEGREDMNIQVVLTRSEDMGHYSESDSNKKMADMVARCDIIKEADADMLVSIHQNSYHSASVHGAQVFYYEQSVQGKILAETIQDSLIAALTTDGRGRVAKSNDNYYILLNVECPAVIVECGFLSNPNEAALLASEEYQVKVAEAIAEGIINTVKNN